MRSKLSRHISQSLHDAAHIWATEMKLTFRDEGVIIFFILVPLLYPLLYSWIYNNEVVREVPVAVVDDSHSALSRTFIRDCDATPEIKVKYYASDIDEAKSLMSRQLVRGIYHIPSDFSARLTHLEQTHVGVYCDMSLMLNFKAVYQTATNVSLAFNSDIRVKLSGSVTSREEELTATPLTVSEVPIFNPSGGYGSFLLPAVLMLILQQTLVLGTGLAAGTSREQNRYAMLIPMSRTHHGIFRIVLGKALCYFMIYALLSVYLTVIVPRLFSFVVLASPEVLFAILLPYLLACIFFGMTVSCLIRYRENVMLIVVFASVPLLFISGISWPQSAMPPFWEAVSWLFPSTFGIRAYVRLNSMGATLDDLYTEYSALWIQVGVYFFLACAVYRYQIELARKNIISRLNTIRNRRAVKAMLKTAGITRKGTRRQ